MSEIHSCLEINSHNFCYKDLDLCNDTYYQVAVDYDDVMYDPVTVAEH